MYNWLNCIRTLKRPLQPSVHFSAASPGLKLRGQNTWDTMLSSDWRMNCVLFVMAFDFSNLHLCLFLFLFWWMHQSNGKKNTFSELLFWSADHASPRCGVFLMKHLHPLKSSVTLDAWCPRKGPLPPWEIRSTANIKMTPAFWSFHPPPVLTHTFLWLYYCSHLEVKPWCWHFCSPVSPVYIVSSD